MYSKEEEKEYEKLNHKFDNRAYRFTFKKDTYDGNVFYLEKINLGFINLFRLVGLLFAAFLINENILHIEKFSMKYSFFFVWGIVISLLVLVYLDKFLRYFSFYMTLRKTKYPVEMFSGFENLHKNNENLLFISESKRKDIICELIEKFGTRLILNKNILKAYYSFHKRDINEREINRVLSLYKDNRTVFVNDTKIFPFGKEGIKEIIYNEIKGDLNFIISRRKWVYILNRIGIKYRMNLI